MMEFFCDNKLWLLVNFYFREKSSFIDVWEGPKYASDNISEVAGKKYSTE